MSPVGKYRLGIRPPGHQLRGLLVVLLRKIPGLPSGLYCSRLAQSTAVENEPACVPLTDTVTVVFEYSSPPAADP